MTFFTALLALSLGAPAGAAESPAWSQLKAAAGSVPPAQPPAARPKAVWKAPLEVEGLYQNGVQIVGSPDFIAATRRALSVIAATRMSEEVFAAIQRIEQAPCSGMNVYARLTTFNVGDATWRADTQWYAGAIVHDSRHAQLYFAAKARAGGLEPLPEKWEDAPGEKAALAYQIRFLELLRASRPRLDYLRALAKDPRYQDVGHPEGGPRPFDPTRASGYSIAGCGAQAW